MDVNFKARAGSRQEALNSIKNQITGYLRRKGMPNRYAEIQSTKWEQTELFGGEEMTAHVYIKDYKMKTSLMKFIDSCVGNIARKIEDEFDESKHPRDKGGKFTSKGGEGSGGGSGTASGENTKKGNVEIDPETEDNIRSTFEYDLASIEQDSGSEEEFIANAVDYLERTLPDTADTDERAKDNYGVDSKTVSSVVNKMIEELKGKKPTNHGMSYEEQEELDRQGAEQSTGTLWPDWHKFNSDHDKAIEYAFRLGDLGIDQAKFLKKLTKDLGLDYPKNYMHALDMLLEGHKEELDNAIRKEMGSGDFKENQEQAYNKAKKTAQKFSNSGIDLVSAMEDLGIDTEDVPEGYLEDVLIDKLSEDAKLASKADKYIESYTNGEHYVE